MTNSTKVCFSYIATYNRQMWNWTAAPFKHHFLPVSLLLSQTQLLTMEVFASTSPSCCVSVLTLIISQNQPSKSAWLFFFNVAKVHWSSHRWSLSQHEGCVSTERTHSNEAETAEMCVFLSLSLFSFKALNPLTMKLNCLQRFCFIVAQCRDSGWDVPVLNEENPTTMIWHEETVKYILQDKWVTQL